MPESHVDYRIWVAAAPVTIAAMIAPMTDRQKRVAKIHPALAAEVLRDESRVYVSLGMKPLETRQKILKTAFTAVAIVVPIAFVVAIISFWSHKSVLYFLIFKGVIAIPFTAWVGWPLYRYFTRPFDALPLFFIDAEKGYAGDLDNCFPIQEIESIGVAPSDGSTHWHGCIAMKLRDGTTHLYASVESEWFNLRDAAAQAEEFRKRFVAPATPLPKPTATEFEMPAMA